MTENTERFDRLKRRAYLASLPALVGIGAASGNVEAQNGVELYANQDGGGIHQIDTSDGSIINTISDTADTWPMVIHPTEDIAYFENYDVVEAIDFDGNTLWTNSPEFGVGQINNFEITADGSKLYASDNEYLTIFDPIDGTEIDTTSVWFSAIPINLAHDPVKGNIYIAAKDDAGGVFAFDEDLDNLLWDRKESGGHISAHSVEASRDGSVLYVGLQDSDEIVLRDPDTGNEINRWPVEAGDDEGIEEIAVSLDDQVVYAGTDDPVGGGSYIHGIDASNGSILWSDQLGHSGYGNISIDPSDDSIYAPNYGSNVKKRNRSDGGIVWESSVGGTETYLRGEPAAEPKGPDGLFDLWDNFLAMVAAIVGAYALIGAWSRSLAIAAWAGYIAFLYIAFETQKEVFLNIAIVTLVLVVVIFAFKFTRLEITGES